MATKVSWKRFLILLPEAGRKTVMRHKLNWMVLTVALMSCAVVARAADVFNMPPGQTSLQFVTVGNPGNAADPATGSLYGAVPYTYQMGKYDVTAGQYIGVS